MSTVACSSAAEPQTRRNHREPILLRLSEVQPRAVEWLWPNRIPLGKITLLAGDPGLGKSFTTLDIASRVTRGAAWPDDPKTSATPGSVVLLSAEDDLEDTICPRLQAAQADLTKVVSLSATRSNRDGAARALSLARDLNAVRAALAALPDCKLLVIDPISAYLGSIDDNSNVDVRTLLFPLAELAAEHRVAVVAVTHLNKKGSGKAIYRALGSLAFIAVARAAWGVIRDPEEEGRRLMVPLKLNLVRAPTGLAFEFRSRGGHAMPVLEWGTAPVDLSPDDLLGIRRAFDIEEEAYRERMSYAAEWLAEQLANGPRSRRDLFFAALLPGIHDTQLYRAAKKLGVIKTKNGLDVESWEWSLPERESEDGK